MKTKMRVTQQSCGCCSMIEFITDDLNTISGVVMIVPNEQVPILKRIHEAMDTDDESNERTFH